MSILMEAKLTGQKAQSDHVHAWRFAGNQPIGKVSRGYLTKLVNLVIDLADDGCHLAQEYRGECSLEGKSICDLLLLQDESSWQNGKIKSDVSELTGLGQADTNQFASNLAIWYLIPLERAMPLMLKSQTARPEIFPELMNTCMVVIAVYLLQLSKILQSPSCWSLKMGTSQIQVAFQTCVKALVGTSI